MQQKTIEGIAIISEDGSFIFDSGLPSAEKVLEFDTKAHRGVMKVDRNAYAAFSPDAKQKFIPPQFDEVLRDKNLIVKRTNRNFIVQMKFPIVESADATTKEHTSMWKKVAAALKTTREKLKSEF